MKKSRLITVCFIIAVFGIQTILPALPQDALRKMKTAADSPKAEETALSDPFPEDKVNLYISSGTILQEVEIFLWERLLFKWPGVLKEQIHPFLAGRFTIKYPGWEIEVFVDDKLIQTIPTPAKHSIFYYKGSLIIKETSALSSNEIGMRKYKILPLTAPKEAEKIVEQIEKILLLRGRLRIKTIDLFKDTVIRKHPLVLTETLEQLLKKIRGTREISKKQRYAYFYFIVLEQMQHIAKKPSIPSGRFYRNIIRVFEDVDENQLVNLSHLPPGWEGTTPILRIIKIENISIHANADPRKKERAIMSTAADVYGAPNNITLSTNSNYSFQRRTIDAGFLMHKKVREELMSHAAEWLKVYNKVSGEVKTYIIAGLFKVKPEQVREALQEVPDSAEVQAITTHLPTDLHAAYLAIRKDLLEHNNEKGLWKDTKLALYRAFHGHISNYYHSELPSDTPIKILFKEKEIDLNSPIEIAFGKYLEGKRLILYKDGAGLIRGFYEEGSNRWFSVYLGKDKKFYEEVTDDSISLPIAMVKKHRMIEIKITAGEEKWTMGSVEEIASTRKAIEPILWMPSPIRELFENPEFAETIIKEFCEESRHKELLEGLAKLSSGFDRRVYLQKETGLLDSNAPGAITEKSLKTWLQKLLKGKTLYSPLSELSLWEMFLRLNNLNDVRIEKLSGEIFSSI